MTVEDRLRATSLAITDTMRDVRPLTLPPVPGPAAARRSRVRTPRRWPPGSPGRLVPLAAAVAVVVIAAVLVAVRGLTAARPGAGPATAVTSAAGIPRYFVSLEDVGANPKGAIERNAFLADTGTGKRLATFKPPPDAIFDYVVGSSDGRTFVLEAAAGPGYGPSGNHALVAKGKTALWYVLRVTPGAARQARLARIPIAYSFVDTGSLGVAVSPDGRTLAILDLTGESPGKVITSHPPMVLLRTYSVATAQLLRTWAAPVSAWVGPPAGLTWLDDGRTVSFVAPTVVPRQYIRTLDTTRPGSSLVAASRPVFALPDLCGSPLLAADGKSVICGTVSALPAAKPACDKGGCDWSSTPWRLASWNVSCTSIRAIAAGAAHSWCGPGPARPLSPRSWSAGRPPPTRRSPAWSPPPAERASRCPSPPGTASAQSPSDAAVMPRRCRGRDVTSPSRPPSSPAYASGPCRATPHR